VYIIVVLSQCLCYLCNKGILGIISMCAFVNRTCADMLIIVQFCITLMATEKNVNVFVKIPLIWFLE